MVDPVEIPNGMAGIESGGTILLAAGGIAEAGTVYPSADGSRLLTHVIDGKAVFVQTEDNRKQPWKIGRVYVQPTPYFDNDINRFGGYAGILSKKLAGTKAVITNFMDIYMGCLSVAGGPLAWSIMGMNIVVAGGKIKQNFDLYEEALEAFVGDDMMLQKKMPIFFDHMFVELYLGRIESDLRGKAKDLASDLIAKRFVKSESLKKVLSGTIGVFIGSVGEDKMKQTLQGISKIIREVLLKVIRHKQEGKPLSEDQVNLLAEHHMVPMYRELSRVPLRMDRAKAIVREAYDNASTVKARLERIAKAIDALAG